MNMSQPLYELHGIGKYLHERIENMLNTQNPTVGTLVTFINNNTSKYVYRKINESLQNKRYNLCVDGVQIQKVNEVAYTTIYKLFLKLKRLDYIDYALPKPVKRTESTKFCGCRKRKECEDRSCIFHDGLCQPKNINAVGFNGWYSSRVKAHLLHRYANAYNRNGLILKPNK